MSETVRKLLDLDRRLIRLRDQRIEAEQRGEALAADAADHEQRSLDQARQDIRAAASDQELNEYEEARHAARINP
ncbi:MAG: hypothetical protein HS116_19385 [Planctomycetes bacterium]|nr:hypothetical protein [Planctomycetota bacterium]